MAERISVEFSCDWQYNKGEPCDYTLTVTEETVDKCRLKAQNLEHTPSMVFTPDITGRKELNFCPGHGDLLRMNGLVK